MHAREAHLCVRLAVVNRVPQDRSKAQNCLSVGFAELSIRPKDSACIHGKLVSLCQPLLTRRGRLTVHQDT